MVTDEGELIAVGAACYTLMHVYERLGWKQQQQQRQCPKVGQEVPRGIKKEVCMLLRLLLVALANFIAKKTLGRASPSD